MGHANAYLWGLRAACCDHSSISSDQETETNSPHNQILFTSAGDHHNLLGFPATTEESIGDECSSFLPPLPPSHPLFHLKRKYLYILTNKISLLPQLLLPLSPDFHYRCRPGLLQQPSVLPPARSIVAKAEEYQEGWETQDHRSFSESLCRQPPRPFQRQNCHRASLRSVGTGRQI